MPVVVTALGAFALLEGWALAQWWPTAFVALVAVAVATWTWLAATAVAEPPIADLN